MKYLVPLLALAALAVPGAALAQTTPPGPPALAPVTPGPVTDTGSAGVAAKAYAISHAGQFLNQRNRHVVRVTDADAACLMSPVVDSRFGCIFTLKVLVISRNKGWDDWGHGDSRSHGRSVSYSKNKHNRHDRERHRRFRVRQFGCLGGLTLDAGPPVAVQLKFVECARIPRGDFDVDEVTPV